MADIITRLKVESKEYDQKIDRARSGLLHMEEACRKVGGTLAVLEKDEKDFVAALGNMETVSTTVRGKLNELTKAFTDLSVQYNRLTDEEKKGDFGKALSQSLDTLKGRIQNARTELRGVDAQLGETKNESNGLSPILDQLAGKFGLNINMFKGFAPALAAVTAALKISKDAFFANEENIDEWGRVVESSQSLYEGFLTAINTGDISGYLGNINEIVLAAREAYDELDRLSTQKAINNNAVKAQQIENERFRTMLRTGRYIAPVDGRSSGGMKTGDLLSKEQLARISQMLKNGMTNITKFVKADVDQSTRAIEALYKEQATQLGISLDDFKAGTVDMTTFEQMLAGAVKYNQYEQAHTTTVQSFSPTTGYRESYVRDNTKNPYEQYKGWNVFKDDGELFQKIIDLVNQRYSDQSQLLSQYGQAYRGINRVEGVKVGGNAVTTNVTPTLDTSALTGFGEIPSLEPLNQELQITIKSLKESKKAWQEMLETASTSEGQEQARQGLATVSSQIKNITNGMQLKGIDNKALEELAERSKVVKEEWEDAAKAISAVGNALSQLEDPAAKVAGMVGAAIAQIALGFAQATASDSKLGVFGWIAAIAGGLGTMLATISAIKSATSGYAEGGIVGGSTFSGDTNYIRANSGEMFINQSDQAKLFAAIKGNNLMLGGGGELVARIRGDQLELVRKNHNRLIGKS